MTNLSSFFKTNLIDDHTAEDVNMLMAAALRAEYTNTETITATKELADTDCQFQVITASGAERTVELAPEATTNHVTILYNKGASNNVPVKDDSGAITYIVLEPGEWAMFLPINGVGWKLFSSELENKGWTPVAETWTYSTASKITIPADGTTRYQKGMKIRLKQGGGWKYFAAYNVASTYVDVIVNTDFTVANAAITDIAYSFIEMPFGWPEWFTRSATGIVTGSGGSAGAYAQSNASARYRVKGGVIQENVRVSITNVGSWSGGVQLTGAVAASASASTTNLKGGVYPFNTNPATIRGAPYSIASSNIIYFVSLMGSANLQWSAMAANDEIQLRDEYQY